MLVEACLFSELKSSDLRRTNNLLYVAPQIDRKLRADYTTTVVSNWGYWIPAQVINFRFVAPVYQVCTAVYDVFVVGVRASRLAELGWGSGGTHAI